MKRNYYLFNPGRMSRKDNTLRFDAVGELGAAASGKPKYIPVEGVDALYIFGSVDTNSALYNFLGRKGVSVHFFDYHEHYTGSFCPKEQLLAGKMQVQQTKAYLNKKKRMHLARGILEAATHNMARNLRYYARKGKGTEEELLLLDTYRAEIAATESVPELMGIEGNCRQVYYRGFDRILTHFNMEGRSKQPPKNPVNALISFGNMMCYTACLDQIYHTQLNPTISFLHEPGTRRYSLSLDLAEVFKPLLVDRLIFRMLNKREIAEQDFDADMGRISLKDGARKQFIRGFDEFSRSTLKHKQLGRKVSYRHLIRLECHKIAKYVLGMADEYKGYRMEY